jgi:hypothetical protein
MLDVWALLYLNVGTALAYAERELEDYRRQTCGTVAGHGTSILDPNSQAAKLVEAKCIEIYGGIVSHQNELGSIPNSLQLLAIKIQRSRKPHQLELYTNDILDEVRHINTAFRLVLSQMKFYYLAPAFVDFFGKAAPFGGLVTKKFPKAQGDIESAGDCLALGQPTACVMHLNRAMEIVTQRLAKKLNVTVNPRDNMGSVLANMTDPIKHMPEKTEAQKRKKELWAECRTNLYHVKMAWRDPAHHGKRDYTEKQARDIMGRMRDFMQQLATLL